MISSLLALEFDLFILSNGALYQTASNMMMELFGLVPWTLYHLVSGLPPDYCMEMQSDDNSLSSGFGLPVELGIDRILWYLAF
jgi:hypothetical protein